MARCSVCGKTFELERTPARPFCSVRCKEIDLGRWLDERYGFPIETGDAPADDAPADDAPPAPPDRA
jgi:endogenous inhibitor of DNA gyrase (YacG/DUF329 family)